MTSWQIVVMESCDGRSEAMRGYDVDGVLTAGVIPKSPYVVISGRTLDEWNRTLSDIGTKVPIYLRPYGLPGDYVLAGKWKAEMIHKLGITEFYEDMPIQIEIIRSACPDCKVIEVKP